MQMARPQCDTPLITLIWVYVFMCGDFVSFIVFGARLIMHDVAYVVL
jgi:hypothetical protein